MPRYTPDQSWWFKQTFKPVAKPKPCQHPSERLVMSDRYGQRVIVCMDCGTVTARQQVTP